MPRSWKKQVQQSAVLKRANRSREGRFGVVGVPGLGMARTKVARNARIIVELFILFEIVVNILFDLESEWWYH